MSRRPRAVPAGEAVRRLAYTALLRIDLDGAYANLLVPRLLDEHPLPERDRHLVTELVYGTVRMRRACDHLVDRFCLRPPEPELRTLLRLGAYQLAFTSIAPHAAVDTSVAIAPGRGRGFVNAVLRRVATAPVEFPDVATRLSYPDWIVARLVGELGEEAGIAALAAMNEPASATRRADGYVQDAASQWVAELVPAARGERAVDLCAAPGGKATALAARTGGTVVALDRRVHRARLIVENARRLGLASVPVVIGDGTRPPLRPRSFDHVLVDAPCSGLGALRRRPDARWRIEEGDVAVLARLQRGLLDAASELVRPGGTVTYSVCTLTAAESTDQDRPQWPALDPPPPPWRPFGRGGLLLPQDGATDGMVVLRWRLG